GLLSSQAAASRHTQEAIARAARFTSYSLLRVHYLIRRWRMLRLWLWLVLWQVPDNLLQLVVRQVEPFAVLPLVCVFLVQSALKLAASGGVNDDLKTGRAHSL